MSERWLKMAFLYSPELIQLLVPGVQAHLGSTDAAVRSRGMLVARLMTKAVDPKGHQIEFEVSITFFLICFYK
jgi:hypothetical protein